MHNDDYEHLTFDRSDDGILQVPINRPERLNAANKGLHWELNGVWLDIGEDPLTRVVVITGAGKAFSTGGDLNMVLDQATTPRSSVRSCAGWRKPSTTCSAPSSRRAARLSASAS